MQRVAHRHAPSDFQLEVCGDGYHVRYIEGGQRDRSAERCTQWAEFTPETWWWSPPEQLLQSVPSMISGTSVNLTSRVQMLFDNTCASTSGPRCWRLTSSTPKGRGGGGERGARRVAVHLRSWNHLHFVTPGYQQPLLESLVPGLSPMRAPLLSPRQSRGDNPSERWASNTWDGLWMWDIP